MIPNIKIIAMLSSLGVVYGLLTVFAAIPGLEHRVALSIVVSVGVCAHQLSDERKLATAFIVGFATVFIAIWTQIAFHELYFRNNPQFASVEVPFGLSPMQYTVVFSPIGGLIGSLISGLAAMLLHFALKLRERMG